jgi:hypothetical protein
MRTAFVQAAHELFESPRGIVIRHLFDLGQSAPYRFQVLSPLFIAEPR